MKNIKLNQIAQWSLIFIVICIFLILVQLKLSKNCVKVDKWIHQKPKDYVSTAIKLFKQPYFYVNKPGGIMVWKPDKKNLFAKHYIKDEEIKHCVPSNHIDYFYSSIKFYVPKSKRLDVLSISGSINYDGLTKLLTARCATIEANIATLYLAMALASDYVTIEKIKSKNLYSNYINGKAKPHKKLLEEMKIMKKKNNEKYKEQLNNPYDPLAFPHC